MGNCYGETDQTVPTSLLTDELALSEAEGCLFCWEYLVFEKAKPIIPFTPACIGPGP